ILYEALTGRVPFEGGPLEVLQRKGQEDPPPPTELVPGLPDDLARLSLELLRRDPAARPSGAEVRQRIEPKEEPGPPVPLSPEGLLVGRGPHLEALRAALAAAREGTAVVMGVAGRSGVGKSALVRRFADELAERREAVVLAGRCYEQE